VDHGKGALRITEQLGKGPDPVKRRVDRVLRPPGEDLVFDGAKFSG
jgi:hypothetical protein